jgi:hypothetical protein
VSFGVARALLGGGAESGCGFNARLCPPPTGWLSFPLNSSGSDLAGDPDVQPR